MSRPTAPLLALLLALALVWAGCDAEPGFLRPNAPPNTRISAGPPEARPTGYQVELFWFGWDEDGFVDHYEVAWESPENWIGPIFSNDSLFVVAAAESCCVPPPPENAGVALSDSVFQQYHTFYVRAVDDNDQPDESPSFRSFNARSLAPYTEITAGPAHLGIWGSDVTFKWEGKDDDGLAVSYKYALTSFFDYTSDTADTTITTGELLAWIDNLVYYPLPGGGYNTDSLVWRSTVEDTVRFRNVALTTDIPPQGNPLNNNKIVFAVRAIDNAGAEEQVLTLASSNPGNVVVFDVKKRVNGPCISVVSNVIGSWNCNSNRDARGVFRGRGLRFVWSARTGGSGTPVAGFSYAVDDTGAGWTAFSENSRIYPPETVPGTPEYWFPDRGLHTLYVRAVDRGGFINVLPINVEVFSGPAVCPEEDRYILVVLDTNLESLLGTFPGAYVQVELGLMQYFFEGYDVQIHRTNGSTAPEVALLDCASSTFWFHSSDAFQGYPSVLQGYHAAPPNVLPSYVQSGGNLFLCGIQPVNAMRYREFNNGTVEFMDNPPFRFFQSLQDTSQVDHWITTTFGINQIDGTVARSDAEGNPNLYVREMVSQITTGPNPYPDLEFDPLSWPQGPTSPGFAHYDYGIQPRLLPDSTFACEVIYRANTTNAAVATRQLTEPGPAGNVVYVGFHPYFLHKAPFKQFLQAVLTDFGEVSSS
ncbi:hypothetical protein K8I85_16075 [bacterium]|nr:hypothetical protein [bacterium]